MKQFFEKMPKEFLEQPRWFRVGEDKRPLVKEWNNPENQKYYREVDGLAGMSLGKEYCLVDFDHVINDGVVDKVAATIFRELFERGIYLEYSISRRGFHAFLRPTPGRFEQVTNKKGKGILYFDEEKDIKLEIFYYPEGGKYALTTGHDVAGCGDRVPQGEEADEILECILNAIRFQYQVKNPSPLPPPPPTTESKVQYENSRDYDEFRFRKMIDAVPIRNLRGDDWLVAATACKANGMSYNEFDSLNLGGETYNAEENLARWNSLAPCGDWLGALHNMAKKYGYSESVTLAEWRRLNPSITARQMKTKINSDELSEADLQIILSGDGSDTANADRLAFMFQNELKFCKDDGTWFVREGNEFGGAVWQQYDRRDALYPHVRLLSDTVLAHAVSIPSEVDGFKTRKGTEYKLEAKDGDTNAVDLAAEKKLRAIVKTRSRQLAIGNKLREARYANSAIEILKGVESVRITQADLNKHAHLVNCQNSVVDLQTGLTYESRDFLPTNQIAACFDTAIDTDFVEKTFREILPDGETCAAVLRFLGYSLTGDKSYHISEFWRGSGANGKSTVLDWLIKVFNTYALKLPSLALVQSTRPLDANAATPAIASLGGDVRLAIVDELPRGVRLNGELFKTLVGDETARARLLYGNLQTIRLRAKLILNGNFLPQFDFDDFGMQRRISRVEFGETFTGDRADALLPKKLASDENRAALLKILVREAKQFYTDGLIESSDMRAAKKDYVDENNFIAAFIESSLTVGEGGKVPRKTLEEKIRREFPAETERLAKKEVFNLLKAKLEELGAEYTKERGTNTFKNVMLASE